VRRTLLALALLFGGCSHRRRGPGSPGAPTAAAADHFGGGAALPPPPAHHPAYLHALADLRNVYPSSRPSSRPSSSGIATITLGSRGDGRR
jgi:hypothetical protein